MSCPQFQRLLSNLTAPPCGPLEPNGPSSPLRPCKEKIHYLILKKILDQKLPRNQESLR